MLLVSLPSELNKEDLETMINGAAFFGSGGGGPVKVAKQMVRKMSGVVKIASIEKAASDTSKMSAVTAYIGSPNDSLHVSIDAPRNAVVALDRVCGQQLTHETALHASLSLETICYLLPVETGVNSIVACVVANAFGIPVIDGDGAGRAVPMLSMLSYAYPKQHTFQTVLANSENDTYVLRLADVNKVESLVGPLITLNEHKAGLVLWPMNAKKLTASVAVPNTLSNCYALGKLLQDENFLSDLPEALFEMGYPSCAAIGAGKISSIQNQTVNNLDNMFIDIQCDTHVLRIISVNENLLAWQNDKTSPVAMAPNLISWVTEAGTAFSAADIEQVGEDIIILGEKNPKIHVYSIEPNRHIQDFQSWPDIQAQFNGVLSKIGYPIPQMEGESK